MGCLSWINKTLLLILNLVLFAIGLGLVVISSVTLYKGDEFGALLADGTLTLPIILLVVGIFVLLLGFFGCCGAMKQNACMLYTYSSVLLILVIAQAGSAIMLLVYKDTAEDFIKDGMHEAFDKYNNTDEHFTEALNKVQNEFKCCGITGPEDWKNATHMDGLSVADGCCKDMKDDCGVDYFDHANAVEIYEDGCYQAIKDDVLELGLGVSGLILAASGVQLIIVILACILAKESKKKEYASI